MLLTFANAIDSIPIPVLIAAAIFLCWIVMVFLSLSAKKFIKVKLSAVKIDECNGEKIYLLTVANLAKKTLSIKRVGGFVTKIEYGHQNCKRKIYIPLESRYAEYENALPLTIEPFSSVEITFKKDGKGALVSIYDVYQDAANKQKKRTNSESKIIWNANSTHFELVKNKDGDKFLNAYLTISD